MRIGVSLESIKINTIAGCLMDLENKPEMTYGDKAKIFFDLLMSFDHARETLDKLGEWRVSPDKVITIELDKRRAV